MNTSSAPRERLWVYTVLPALILNLLGLVVFGGYYAMAAVRPDLVAGIGPGQVSFVFYMLIALVELSFAFALIVQSRRAGQPWQRLLAPSGTSRPFRWAPAIAVFMAYNLLFSVYVVWLRMSGAAISFGGLASWQRAAILLQGVLIASTCEELIWRGYIVTRLEARGHGKWVVALLSAVSWACIHGVYLPDKLLVTFLIGIPAAWYYASERRLLSLTISHAVPNLWSFGLMLFVWT